MLRKITSVFMSVVLLAELISPTVAYALSSGPKQPEFQQFAPAGVNDMVDLFTGDFKYNIPLLDVEGYPININYASGVTMEQEASWVGLGWSLNVGSINRNMRGLPDDFNGDAVTKELNLKENVTVGASVGGGTELIGADKIGLSINGSLGAKWNSYEGVSADMSISPSLRIGESGKSPLNVGLGISSSAEEGLTLQPSISMSTKASQIQSNDESFNRRTSFAIGSTFNSRSGMKSLSFSSSTNYSKDEKKVSSVSSSATTSASFDLTQPTYTPSVSMPMRTTSLSGRFTAGGELFGLNGHVFISGFKSVNELDKNSLTNPAYGYLYSESGSASGGSALMDFNREKDGAVGLSTPALAIPNYTCDIFAVSGQGIGGSYRPYRSNIPHVFDADGGSRSSSGSIGFEIGAGNAVKVGADISVVNTTASSGRWVYENSALVGCNFKRPKDPLFEPVYFKEANEKTVESDDNFASLVSSPASEYITLNKYSEFHVSANNSLSAGGSFNSNYRKTRDKRNQLMTVLKRAEVPVFGLQDLNSQICSEAKPHHLSEITVTGTDGRRYIYGLPTYNISQEEVSFAVSESYSPADVTTGLITYESSDITTGNKKGKDNYYSSTKTPAYPTSFLLTALLSTDYADADNVKGPSIGDIGSYTIFNYEKKSNDFKWRTPFEAFKATFNEGLKYDPRDDKASFVYGVKELWYLKSIETRNYIAEFIISERQDCKSVAGRDGGVGSGISSFSYQLDKIILKSKRTNKIVKEIEFDYDYSLCTHIPNSTSGNDGKLTLKTIKFKYQDSFKARLSPYEFTYQNDVDLNVIQYNQKDVDRWGNFKKQDAQASYEPTTGTITNAEYPYSLQDKVVADKNVALWNITDIKLPSGGIIHVDYESDEYAYVQDKPAQRMFKVVSAEATDFNATNNAIKSFPTGGSYTNLVVQLDRDLVTLVGSTGAAANYFKKHYLKGVRFLHFQFLCQIYSKDGETLFERVPGYIEMPENIECSFDPSHGDMAIIRVANTNLKDNGNGTNICPIARTAIQFGRLNMARKIWGNPIADENPSVDEDILKALAASNIVAGIRSAIKGANEDRYDAVNSGKKFVAMKSWIRLNEPTGHKLGGGARVRQITMQDEWYGMTTRNSNSGEASSTYGQLYNYDLEDGRSSGVAAYEPGIGGEENPLRQPVFNIGEGKKLMAPDDQFYMEEPFGEAFFPSPVVGYSRITVTDYVPQLPQGKTYTMHATGKVVSTFYTARDFPVIYERTRMDHVKDKENPFLIRSLLKIDVRDFFTASQGYVVELNDMHGKPRTVEVYAKGQNEPISSSEYIYQKKPYLNGSYRLDNICSVIMPDGNTASRQIGVNGEAVADFRESSNKTISVTAAGNMDGFVIPLIIPVFVPVPMLWPSFNSDRTQFRSAVWVKVIQKFGILERTVVKDLGSTIETKNLAYDSETGDVLLTETINNFNDHLYSMKYPAYWHYQNMGPAYKNINYTTPDPVFVNYGYASGAVTDVFVEGDEVVLIDANNNPYKGWIVEKLPGKMKIIDRLGAAFHGDYRIRIMRSGRKNQQMETMATIVTKDNPLPFIKNNMYDGVLQAGAVEYANTWRIFCGCFDNTTSPEFVTMNPFLTGRKGYWRPYRNYTYLTERTQSQYNNNTNIRHDGEFTAYAPFYKCNSGKWIKDDANWTFANEITQYNSYGLELENQDALGRYSANTFSFNQTQVTASAVNAGLQDIGYASFEDYNPSVCNDKHFRFNVPLTELDPESHSGYNSLKVDEGQVRSLKADVGLCEKEKECQITYDITLKNHQTPNTYSIDFKGAISPYNIEYEVLAGSAVVYVNDNSLSIQKPTANAYFVVELRITDANLCTKKLVFTYNNGQYSLNGN